MLVVYTMPGQIVVQIPWASIITRCRSLNVPGWKPRRISRTGTFPLDEIVESITHRMAKLHSVYGRHMQLSRNQTDLCGFELNECVRPAAGRHGYIASIGQ